MLTMYEFLHRLPKMEMHLHLEGSIRPGTAADLAHQNNVILPPHDRVEDLYHYRDLKEFLAIYTAVSDSVIGADDYRRITYEMLESCAANNARYVEFFFSPQVHLVHGVSFDTMIDGITTGMDDAKVDFGLDSRIIPGVNRELGPEAGEELLDMILARKEERLIGIGLDFLEAPFPPEPYAALFARARKAGLKVTAHAGESGPAAYIAGSIDTLGVARIDHGYHVVTDEALMRRCRDDGILFTCCPSTAAVTSPWKSLDAEHPIRRMADFGLKLTINSDDPPMFSTDLGEEYRKAHDLLGFSPDMLRRSILDGIDCSWLDDDEKRTLSADWTREIDALIAEIQPTPALLT
ncbi:adenosine deaminase [Rhizobium sp. TRM95796]|uniref:adenosine deaminase n=1 Tax=Rhizobium sp. TRM95796 TaxID=2979862 RepID=UPI0021E95A86|nr:adenosine deaminase [Rhizobium sp. TRM95796]MCV3764553.1 adenosine deaminase [Rhizobium sp. TRM95796]